MFEVFPSIRSANHRKRQVKPRKESESRCVVMREILEMWRMERGTRSCYEGEVGVECFIMRRHPRGTHRREKLCLGEAMLRRRLYI